MRLHKNVNLESLIGNTVIIRGQFWNVEQVCSEGLRVGKFHDATKGLISMRQLDQCRLYPTRTAIAKSYPRLLRAMRWACILSHGEAEGAIEGFIVSGGSMGDMGSEAVAHAGGSLAVIRHAIRCRAAVRHDIKTGGW